MESEILHSSTRRLCRGPRINPSRVRVRSQQDHPKNRAFIRKIMWTLKQDVRISSKDTGVDCTSLIQLLTRRKMPLLAQEILLEIKSEGLLPNNSTLSALMLCYADNGMFSHANAIWEEMLSNSFLPCLETVSEFVDAYAKVGRFEEVTKILDQVSSRNPALLSDIFSLAISCFGKQGQLELMENTLKEMVSRGFLVDSATGNSFLTYYSKFGSLTEMETAYGRLKRSRHLIEKEAIRAMSHAYIKREKYFKLGEFVRDVGLGRKNVGNLLWNLLLLSYASNFKMKSLQREFLRMLEAGFHPDLTTFNIRALAFTRMSLFWDLHLSLEHMNHETIVPDIVTCGCVVDAYLDRRLGRNLEFALSKIYLPDYPLVLTDPFVFEVLGKGDFHSSSEVFMESRRQRKWNYKELVAIYLKKQHRSNQIFWNY